MRITFTQCFRIRQIQTLVYLDCLAQCLITRHQIMNDRTFGDLDFAGPSGLVVGAEGHGLRRLVREGCDFVARIPMGRAAAGSLNASVAAGVVLYEVFRQRENARPADGGSAAPS